MNKVRLKTSAFAMSYISNEEKVRDMVRGLDIHMRRQPRITDSGIKVSAVCFTPEICKNLRDYVNKMNDYIAPAAAEGSAIVAFPELCGMTAMSLMPRFKAICGEWRKLRGASQEDQREAMLTVCETVQGFVSEVFLNTFSQLARSHRMIIAAGGIYQIENGRLYNRQYLFNEEGEVCAMQDKLFLTPTERALGVSSGKRLTPGATRLGNVALLGGSSLRHYEPYWIAAAMNCRFAVASASPYIVTEHKLARYRAQEQGMCLLLPGCSGGKEFGISLASPAGIYVPRGSEDHPDGIAAESMEKSLVTALVNPAKSQGATDIYSADKNIEFLRTLIGPPQPEGLIELK